MPLFNRHMSEQPSVIGAAGSTRLIVGAAGSIRHVGSWLDNSCQRVASNVVVEQARFCRANGCRGLCVDQGSL
jgi:hypothetical protein